MQKSLTDSHRSLNLALGVGLIDVSHFCVFYKNSCNQLPVRLLKIEK